MTTALNLANHGNFIDINGALPLSSSGASGILPTTKGGTGINYTPVLADVNKTLLVKNTGSALSPVYQFQVSNVNLTQATSYDTAGNPVITDYTASADGLGGVKWNAPSTGGGSVGVAVPNIAFTATTAGLNQTFSSGIFSFYNSVTSLEVLWNGVALVPTEDFLFTGPSGSVLGFITILASINVGDSIEVAPAFASQGPIPGYKTNLAQNQTTVTDALFQLYNSVNDLEVTINGITLVPGEDFQLLGSTITLIYTATANDVFQVQPSSAPGRETVPVWTSPLNIPANGFVVASSATFTQPGGVFVGTLTLLQGTQATTVSATWLNLGALGATGNSALWTRLV